MGFGRVLTVGAAAALIALILAAAPVGGARESRAKDRIAFTFGESGVDRPSQLAVMDADGKNRRALRPFGLFGLSWSPDGRSIAFALTGFGKRRDGIYTMNVDGGNSRLVVRNGVDPDWSPDGRSIAFDRCGFRYCDRQIARIWVVNLRDHRQRRVVRKGWSPSWSPDGRKLAFERWRRKVPDVWLIDVNTKKERRLVRNGDNAEWSPDARQIAFQRDDFIYVIRLDGSGQRRLFEGDDPAWSPDGQEIAFIGSDARRGYHDPVMRERLDGSGRRVLFGQPGYCACGFLDWSAPPRRGRR